MAGRFSRQENRQEQQGCFLVVPRQPGQRESQENPTRPATVPVKVCFLFQLSTAGRKLWYPVVSHSVLEAVACSHSLRSAGVQYGEEEVAHFVLPLPRLQLQIASSQQKGGMQGSLWSLTQRLQGYTAQSRKTSGRKSHEVIKKR